MNPLKILQSMFASAPRFSVADCHERVRSGAALPIDGREPGEWIGGVAERAVRRSLRDLTGARVAWQPFLAANADRELLLYCGAGVRSAIAARILAREGFRAANARSLAEWSAASWPIVAPET